MSNEFVESSFRDPSGFLFYRDGILFRQINQVYRDDYKKLMESGLYKSLAETGLLIPHEETDLDGVSGDSAYCVIKPEPISFISYPYEWSFSQLKDAALTTLAIQVRALEFGMNLKDASAYNIQFHNGKPTLIDTLSFEKYREGEPWVAYRQFCQHFLAPLALMSSTDVRLGQISKIYIDGIPLDLASELLPFRTRLKLPLLLHIHLHAKSQKHYADKRIDIKTKHTKKISKHSLLGLIKNLESVTAKMTWKPANTEWGDYYEDTNYTDESQNHKCELIAKFLEEAPPKIVWDLGANTGFFSRIASEKGIRTIAFDIDPAAVEKCYFDCRKRGEKLMLPLLQDLTNPSPWIGWQNRERFSLEERGPVDMVFALALIHHLAISNNVPLVKIAEYFAKLTRYLIIEFIPKNDSQVQRLLTTREDIFPEYVQSAFEQEFKRYFEILNSVSVHGSERTLYLMKTKAN